MPTRVDHAKWTQEGKSAGRCLGRHAGSRSSQHCKIWTVGAGLKELWDTPVKTPSSIATFTRVEIASFIEPAAIVILTISGFW